MPAASFGETGLHMDICLKWGLPVITKTCALRPVKLPSESINTVLPQNSAACRKLAMAPKSMAEMERKTVREFLPEKSEVEQVLIAADKFPATADE